MNVTIYFKNGSTAYFKDVEEYTPDAKNICFTYFGVSSQERIQAVFYKDSIAGVAYTKELENEQETTEQA